MPFRNRWTVATFWLCLVMMAAYPGEPDPSSSPSAATMRTSVEEVRVAFSALDSRGRAVAGLRVEDVAVFDDDQRVPEITGFYKSSDLPLRVTLLVDTSESMTGIYSAQSAAASWLAGKVVRPGLDQLSVRTFSETSVVATRSGDASLVRTALRGLRPSGQTAMFDALLRAIDEAKQLQKDDPHPARQVLVVLTDGDDNFSLHTLDDVIAAAQHADIVVYTINAHNRRFVFPGDILLRRLAQSTGGRTFLLPSYSGLPNVFPQLEAELGAQYAVTFRPGSSAARNRWHRLRVEVHVPGNVQVRSRSGYYLSE
jgi:VWFA-related protein